MDNQVNLDNNIWVFLSHSNKDYEAVRLLRNILEEDGYRPIMFFLRCLSEDEEIADLIKREIDSRRLFILCDSPNSRSSAWVRKEVEYIKSQRRYYQTIKLDAPLDAIRDQIRRFRKDSTIYLFYSRENRALYQPFRNALQQEMGFDIHDWRDTFRGLPAKAAIDKACENGFAFFLLPEGTPPQGFSMEDIEYARNHELADRVCVFIERKPDLADFNSIMYRVEQDGEVVFEEDKLYLHVMLDRIRDGAKYGEPASQYWLAYYNFHYCVQFEYGLYAESFRRHTLTLAKSAADAGYAPAKRLFKEILEDIRHWYPEDLDTTSL